jgi:hypothetical protein
MKGGKGGGGEGSRHATVRAAVIAALALATLLLYRSAISDVVVDAWALLPTVFGGWSCLREDAHMLTTSECDWANDEHAWDEPPALPPTAICADG